MGWAVSSRPSCGVGCCLKSTTKTGNAEAGKLALDEYQEAATHGQRWRNAQIASTCATLRMADIPMRRGHWSDRLAGIDKDIAAMQGKLQTPPRRGVRRKMSASLFEAATGKPIAHRCHCTHTPPASFHPGQPLSFLCSSPGHDAPDAVHLYYRHVNQGERWVSVEMQRGHEDTVPPFLGTTPTLSIRCSTTLCFGGERMRRGFFRRLTPALSNQPYYAIADEELDGLLESWAARAAARRQVPQGRLKKVIRDLVLNSNNVTSSRPSGTFRLFIATQD